MRVNNSGASIITAVLHSSTTTHADPQFHYTCMHFTSQSDTDIIYFKTGRYLADTDTLP